MAKTLSINTTDIMGSYLEFTQFEDCPQFDGSIDFPDSEQTATFADPNQPHFFNETSTFPKYEESSLEFPAYEEPPEFSESEGSISNMAEISDTPRSPQSPTNKQVDHVVRTPGRKPSPQPTHFSVPIKNGNGNGHRILRSATVGYIAPEFKGKAAQMLQGRSFTYSWVLL
jgi:hypothetical protein